ncbi:MAG: CDP-diacylglycerol--glycerol-3-phosphate 3-phosphatidyltransferase [Clostridia bacterium]|nr:CDP-diacylglycerol--glycerol-3-phosphate 3-phosphatidyltransferase [Clostridia bacterium]
MSNSPQSNGMFHDFFKDVWNVPNALTMVRLLLIPVYLVVHSQGHRLAALIIFLAASFTDLLDGYLARKNNQVTNFGKLMDPLADKVMVICVMMTQTLTGCVPWAVMITVIMKELLMVIGGAFMLKAGIVVYADVWGKVAQFSFVVGLVLSFFHDNFAALGAAVDQWILWLSLMLTLFALFHYAQNALKQLKAKK